MGAGQWPALSRFKSLKEDETMETKSKELLRDKRVIDEINRHKWIESEKAGRDIGFDRAADDWIDRFSDEWTKRYSPQKGNGAKVIKIKKQQLKDK